MKSLLFNFPFVLKQESRETGLIVQNLIQRRYKGIEMFMMLKRKTCPGLYEDILNSYKALSSKNEWPLFFSDQLIISATSKLAELTLSSDLALNVLMRQ